MGDELLTRAVVDVLHGAGAAVVVASRDPVGTKGSHPGVDAVPWGVAGVRSMGRIDGVCVGPGGILQDTSSLWSLPSHLAMPWLARRRGAAVAAVGVGAEPLRFGLSRRLLGRVLGGVVVVTRDGDSTEVLRAAGLDPVTAVDVVFGLAPPRVETRPEIVVAVGPGTRPGRILPASRRLVAPPIDEIARAVDGLAARLGCRVVLTRFRGERDLAAAARIAPRLTVDHEVLDDDIDEHVRRIAGATLVVSSRYHPIVVAAASAVPVLVVSDQRKLVSLVEQIGDPSVQRANGWAALADAELPPRPASPQIPAGLHRAHEALSTLVLAARTTRGEDGLG